MKIAFVCPRYYPFIGGVETHVQSICEGLNDCGIKPTVLTTTPNDLLPRSEEINNVSILRFKGYSPNNSYHFSFDLLKYLSTHSNTFDIIHTHSYASITSLFASHTKNQNKLVFTPHYHGKGHTKFRNLLHKPYKYFGKAIFHKSEKIISVSKHERSLLINDFSISPDKVVVIPNGIQLTDFTNFENRRKKTSENNILYVGRLEKYKNVDKIIATLPLLSDDVNLRIVGVGSEKANLYELARELKILGRVTFLNNVSRLELLEEYFFSDLFILLSSFEAYGITVAEALASQTPSIVLDSGALSEWIDGKNCFGLTPPIDTIHLSQLIGAVIGKRIDHVGSFTWTESINKHLEIYNEIF
mgnify:CR=1 FL=1|jgi:glycosyltransferase involved in cell wall biosynthesis